MANTGYSLAKAFAAIETQLINSMIRNMKRHRAEETDEGIHWSQWQAEQLKALEIYRKTNKEHFGERFEVLNGRLEELLRATNEQGMMEQEESILKAIRNGFTGYERMPQGISGEFFRTNERKLNALVKATTDDMQKAETAVLRMSNDQYRKIIFNAQVYANTGAGTYEQAVDMATKDMLSAGLNCVQYANGSRHTLSDYADMAIKTASKRAYLQGEGTKRQEWGEHLVIMAKRGNPCPKCLPFVGKILIDDVWSGGSRKDGKYPLMSTAIKAGLYHPRCKDSHTTYFPGITTADGSWTKEELEAVEKNSKEESRQQYAERQEEKYTRLSENALDDGNKALYSRKANVWKRARFKTGGMDAREYADTKRPLANFRATPQERVVDVLRKESEGWLQGLSKEEKYAIRKYTYNPGDKKPNRFYERLNAMLRGDLPENKSSRKYANIISGALKKSTLKHDVMAFRGIDADPLPGALAGDIVSPGQFYSTSVIASKAFGAKYKISIYVKKGSKAAYIEKLSHFDTQRELLLDKDCIYRVISRKGNEIELEVI